MYAWQATVQDEAGNIVPLPVVTVYNKDGTTLANIFNEAGSQLPNPMTGTMEGFVQFWARRGQYIIVGATGSGLTRDWRWMAGDWSQPFPSRSSAVYNLPFIPDDVLQISWEDAFGGVFSVSRQSGSSIIPDMVGWVVPGVAKPQHFGAVGNGVANDTDSVSAAISSGHPIDFGDYRFTYRITTMIELNISHPIQWTADGARVLCDFPMPNAAIIDLTVMPHRHKIDGVLWFSCEKKCRRGFRITCPAGNLGVYPRGYPNLEMNSVVVEDPYLTVTNDSCEGFAIRGGWDDITINNPYVMRSVRAAGSGLFGSYGAFGITVDRIGSGTAVSPHNVEINSPQIDTVMSEDPLVYEDQDGIRILMAYKNGGEYGSKFTYTVTNGWFRNCRNRSFKGQANMGNIVGCYFIRDAGVSAAVLKGTGPEVDEQIGSLSMSGCKFLYDTYIPACLVQVRTRSEQYTQPSSQFSSFRVQVQNYSGGEFDAIRTTIESGANSAHHIHIEGVDIAGVPVRYFLTTQVRWAGGPLPRNIFNLSSISCDLSAGSLIYDFGNGTGQADVNISDVINTGPATANIFTAVSAATSETFRISADSVRRFVSADYIQSTGMSGASPQVSTHRWQRDTSGSANLLAVMMKGSANDAGGTTFYGANGSLGRHWYIFGATADDDHYDMGVGGVHQLFQLYTSRLRIRVPVWLPSYTVASAPTFSTFPHAAGTVIYVSNGDSGQPCLAVSDGSAWRRVPLGAAISTS